MLLHGFDGGLVREPSVALELARLICPSVVKGLPPAIDDRGDTWRISSINRSGHDWLIIRKVDAAVDAKPSIHALPAPKTVEKFAEILIESSYGYNELKQQIPLTIVDKESSWEVLGHGDTGRSDGGSGRFHLEVQKHDARVLDMSFQWSLPIPAEVKILLRKPISQ